MTDCTKPEPNLNSNQKISFDHGFFLIDAGLETTMIFHRKIDLPCFAAMVLLETPEGQKELTDYFTRHLDIAREYDLNFIFDTVTWRANPDWGEKLGYSLEGLRELNVKGIQFARELKEKYTSSTGFSKIFISGHMGPRGDSYFVKNKMTIEEAQQYHSLQIQVFAEEKVDLISAYTLNYSNEAIGIVRAAKEVGLPVVISFTVETNACLPGGEPLKEAIERTDKETGGYASHYLINCAHPSHFIEALKEEGEWKKRLRGLRANSSTKSHAELEQSKTLDIGDYNLLAEGYSKLRSLLPNFNVIGGCCGTDYSHIEYLCKYLFRTTTG